jgi:hypothetical protein
MRDTVHERMVLSCAGLTIDGWVYKGYRIGSHNRDQFYSLRFEKPIIDKLAASDVKVWSSQFHDPAFDLRNNLAARLGAVNDGMTEIRKRELS